MDLLGYEPVYSEPGTVEYYMETVARQQNQIGIAMVTGPVYPATKFAIGEEDRGQIAFTQGMAALETFLFYRAIGYSAPFAEQVIAKHAAKKAILQGALGPAYVPAMVGAVSVVAGTAYIDTMREFEPEGNRHDKSGFWQGISAAMAGTFGGMSVV